MISKKIVFVIVEGPSDATALRIVLEKVFSNNKVFVKIVHGDVTSEYQSSPTNIVKKVNELIKDVISRDHLKRADILRIIHLMDTDGTYIPDEAVVEIPTVKDIIYNITNVMTADRDDTLERNRRKAANMDRLATLPSIAGTPYLAVYMSCNLDHVLYNKVNSTEDEKKDDARRFASKYRNDIPAFISFVSESDFSVAGERKETWEFIREGLHSIERYTNLGLCLPQTDETEF